MTASRGALILISLLCTAAGAAGLLLGLWSAFVHVPWMTAADPAWDVALLVALLFEGVLMVSAGLTGIQRDTLTGARLLGVLMLGIALVWLMLSLLAESGAAVLAAGAVVLSLLFLLGVRRARPRSESS